jgi:DNA repair protein RadD
MITLRPYQQEAVAKLQTSLGLGSNPVCAAPTGSGKSVMIAELCNCLDGRILVVTHRKELIQQNENTLLRLGSDSIGAYSAGLNRRDTDTRVVFAGVPSIYRKMNELQRAGDFKYILYDETHHGLTDQNGSTMGDQVLRACPSAQRVGFSATPYRMPDIPIWGDKDSWFDELGYESTISELTEQGYLCRLVGVQAASSLDLSHVRTRGGEFALGDLSQASSEEEVVNSACDEIVYLARDRHHILIFCVDREHAAIVVDALRERGCAPETVLGNTPSQARADILCRFKAGKIRHLVSVGVLTTGFDASNVDCVVLLRASKSKSLIVQMLGRGSRLCAGKQDCLILDAAENLRRHIPIDGIPKVMRSPKLAEEESQERVSRKRIERERLARHDAFVAKGIDPLAAEVEEDGSMAIRVTEAKYMLRPAKKYPDRNNLLVSYRGVTAWGAERRVTQFVLFQYPGRPGVEASTWFTRRGMVKPEDPRRALAMAWVAPTPTEIIVRKKDGWDQVMMEHFDEDIERGQGREY